MNTPRYFANRLSLAAAALLFAMPASSIYSAESVLFIGNSFATLAMAQPARYYRADTVTDLNKEGTGGVSRLFNPLPIKLVSTSTCPDRNLSRAGLDFHLENRLELIGQQPWDHAVMHGFSTLDRDAPGNPAKLIETAAEMAAFLRGLNASTELYLSATWSRADMRYTPRTNLGMAPPSSKWRLISVRAMTKPPRALAPP